VKLDIIGDITVPITSKEMTLAISDFNMQVLEPIGNALAIGIDQYIAGKILQSVPTENIVNATDNPTNLKDISDLAIKLDLAKAPKTNRTLVLSPTHKQKYALTSNLSYVAYAGDSVTLREALLGRVYGFQTLESSYNPVGTGGGTVTAVGKVTVSGTAGNKTIKLESVTPATGTIKKGDLLIIDGKPILVNEDATATSGTIASLAIEQSDADDLLNGTYGTGEGLTYNVNVSVSTKDVSLAFSDIAFGLVNAPLELPMNNPSSAIASYNGINVRVFYGYDQNAKTQKLSVDTLFGFASFYPETSAKLIG
jgi:invasion protein IalB